MARLNSASVYETWARNRGGDYRSGGAVSTRGNVALSYNAVLARLVVDEHGETVALVNTRRYSVTTSKHQSWLWGALAQEGIPTIRAYGEPGGSTRANMASMVQGLVSELPGQALKVKRARVIWSKEVERRILESRIADIREVCRRFNLELPKLPEEGADPVAFYADAEEARVRAERAAARERAKRWKEEFQKTVLPRWKAGEGGIAQTGTDTVYLRVIEHEGGAKDIQTSTRQVVPVTDKTKENLRRVLRVYESVKETGESWERGACGQIIVLDAWAVDKVTRKGVFIGCHRFPISEVLWLCEQLGVTLEPNEG